jgi:hypothetical protein
MTKLPIDEFLSSHIQPDEKFLPFAGKLEQSVLMVSTKGNIIRYIPEQDYKPITGYHAYPKVTINFDTKNKSSVEIYRLVAEAHVPILANLEGKEILVRHLGDDRSNSRASCLRWGTRKDNQNDRWDPKVRELLLVENREEWATVQGASLYEVSTLGRVRRKATVKMLSTKPRSDGYCYLNTRVSRKRVSGAVHVITYNAFANENLDDLSCALRSLSRDPTSDPHEFIALMHKMHQKTFGSDKITSRANQVRHLDSDRSNNALSNLACGTAKENADDREEAGNTFHGHRHHSSRLTKVQVLEIKRRIENKETDREISKDYGVTYQAIWAIRTGRSYRRIKPI